MKPFILLQSRPEDEASDNEYEGFLCASGLRSDQLERIRVEAGPLPPFSLDDYSAVMIGGGPFNFSKPHHEKTDVQKRIEKDLHRLLDTIVEKDFPLFGACYGVGIVGAHQGAVINDAYAEVLNYTSVEITAEGRRDPLLIGLPQSFQVIVGHKEACESLPAHARLLLASTACPIQMFKFKNNIYVTQFHPELDLEGLRLRVEIYKHAGYFPPEEGEKIIAQIAQADLAHPPRLLQNFVCRYARPVNDPCLEHFL